MAWLNKAEFKWLKSFQELYSAYAFFVDGAITRKDRLGVVHK
jgi:hypothetical protein